jgi:hypothetical protein
VVFRLSVIATKQLDILLTGEGTHTLISGRNVRFETGFSVSGA